MSSLSTEGRILAWIRRWCCYISLWRYGNHMQTILGSILLFIFLALASLHAYWAMGGNTGLSKALPQKAGRVVAYPPPAVTLAVAFGLVMCALVVLGRMGHSRLLPGMLTSAGSWVLAGIFFLRGIGDFKYLGLFKKVRSTPFAQWDSRFYSPLCFFISASLFILSIA